MQFAEYKRVNMKLRAKRQVTDSVPETELSSELLTQNQFFSFNVYLCNYSEPDTMTAARDYHYKPGIIN